METMKWIELAVSKDKYRENLMSVYRDTNCLVATDGHRLHLSNGLPEVEPHYLNGLDAEFPDYTQCMPKQIGNRVEISGNVLHRALNGLKKIVALTKHYDKGCAVELSFDREFYITVTFVSDDMEYKTYIPILETNVSPDFKVGVNLRFLYEALLMSDGNDVDLYFNGELGPIEIKSEARKALIMPIRLK